VLFARPPHAAPATELFDLVAQKGLEGVLGATTVTRIFHLAAKAAGAAAARRHFNTLLGLFDIAAVGRAVLADAVDLGFKDCENAVLHEAARHAAATAIVTRDPAGFARASLRVYRSAELLRLIRAAS
jgi:hypothetical protein